jgi:tetratricopeptide (TPR) repeat protein
MPVNPHLDRLRNEITQGHALAIVGAGISIGATRNARAASWTGLLEDGVDRCQALGQPADWADRLRAEIHSGDLDDLLSAAEKVSRKLGAPKKGEFHIWLRETVGALEAQDRAVLEALRNLDIPLATTNYDDLLEDVTDLPPVTWRDGSRVERLLRGDEKGILHLHGHWDDPESVVLGIRSYEEVREDPHTQAVLRALRTLRTLIFIGCGDGLSDPNFGAFLTWTREVLPETEYPHYRLCLDGEVATLRGQHPDGEPIVLLPYGPKHSDLAPFLRSLGTARPHPAPAPEPHSAPRLPPLPRCFGRDDEVETLVAALCADPPRPVPILGPGGVGKTTVTLAALHDRRVAERFGARRWFIRCESATSRDALIGEIATGIGLEPGGQLAERVFRELEREWGVLVLDNAETPWEGDQERVEELLTQLGGLGLALGASIRGEERPLGPDWREAIRIGPLPLPAARDAFMAVAGERFRSDPGLDRLLEAVDRVPLAVTLMSCQAQADPDLSGLWARWQNERTNLLQRGNGRGRLISLEVSLEMSIKSPRMTEMARRLLSLLGILPDGIAHEDLSSLLPAGSEAASSTLRRVGLAFSQAARLRVLAPVREHVGRRHPSEDEDLDRARLHYLKLAELGGNAGREGGAEAAQRLGPETGNLEAMILRTLTGPNPVEAMEAALRMADLFRVTGLGASNSVERALETAKTIGDYGQEAECLRRLGNIALYHSDHDAAQARYEEALPLFRRVRSVLGEANCILRLGDIALARLDHDAARARCEEALPLYRRIGHVLGEANCIQRIGNIALARSDHDGAQARNEEALPLFRHIEDVLGQANCIKSLGDISLARSDYAAARARYEEALPLYKRVGEVLGEANCIKSLGDIALRRSDHDDARARYEEVLPLYRRVGSVLGEANCIQRLGDIAFERSDHDDARAHYEEALPLLRRVGNVLGEANCIQSLGDIALRHSDEETARSCFEKALGLYSRIQDPYSIGLAHVRLAWIAGSAEDRQRHIEAAREAWTRIKRPDLVEGLDQEFGPASPPPVPAPAGGDSV